MITRKQEPNKKQGRMDAFLEVSTFPPLILVLYLSPIYLLSFSKFQETLESVPNFLNVLK